MTLRTSTSGAGLYATAVVTFAVLVVCMWAWYGLGSGMGYETSFPFSSETTDRGRHFGMDMRRFTSLFYHFAYVLGAWIGLAGSYVPYQILYAALWLLRGVLVFHIVRMLGDRRGVVAVLAGAFTILHAADTTLNWVGQLNQFGFIFWMLLAFVALLKAFELEHRLVIAVPIAVLATQLARICIYSYESPLPLIFGFPVLAVTLFLGWSRRKALLLGVFYSLPLQYCWRWLMITLERDAESDYQRSVLRQDWSVSSISGDWVANVWHSLAFWQWPRIVNSATEPKFMLVAVVSAAVSAAVLLGAHLWITGSFRPGAAVDNPGRLQFRLLALGIAMVVLSYPAYLLLDSATSHWRTQLLSGPGAGITLASVVAIAAQRWPGGRHGTWVAAALIASIAASGVWSAQELGLKHRLDWDKHRAIVAGMLQAAPRVSDGTAVVLVNRRAEALIFGHNMWWDYAVRLAYPGRTVTGVYYDRPGEIAPGVRMSFAGKHVFIESDTGTLIDLAKLDQLLLLEALPGDRVRLAQTIPDWLGVPPGHRHLYRPQGRIQPGPPDQRALRRFGPLPGR